MSRTNIKHISTVGYEKTGFSDFVRCLKSAGVTHILDVRDLPLSRRAGFSKFQLAAGLEEVGIAYSHLKGLGTPKEARIAVRQGKIERFREIFSTHMNTDIAKAELDNAIEFVRQEECCLLCFEAEPECCHRSAVAAILMKRTKLPVRHLRIIPV